jgi:hypothetical protein
MACHAEGDFPGLQCGNISHFDGISLALEPGFVLHPVHWESTFQRPALKPDVAQGKLVVRRF